MRSMISTICMSLTFIHRGKLFVNLIVLPYDYVMQLFCGLGAIDSVLVVCSAVACLFILSFG